MPLGGGSVEGPELNGSLVEGGVDWQVQRADGVTDISAHYVIRTTDGATDISAHYVIRTTDKVMALATGQREQQRVLLDVWRVG